MTSKAAYSIRTLEQAYAFVLQVGICGIFPDANAGLVSLWDVTDLPDRKKGEKGWGQKVSAIWLWKNELPAIYPDRIFYGKIPPGRAALMSLDYLRTEHYRNHYRPVNNCSPLANQIHRLIRFDPMTTGEMRKEMGMTNRPERTKFDRALQELQTTLDIVRRNSLEDEKDTWVFSMTNIWRWCVGTKSQFAKGGPNKLRNRGADAFVLVHQVSDWCSGVAIKMVRRQGATKELSGSIRDRGATQPPAHFHRNPLGGVAFDRQLCRSSVKDHSGYSPSSLRASSQNSQQRRYTSH